MTEQVAIVLRLEIIPTHHANPKRAAAELSRRSFGKQIMKQNLFRWLSLLTGLLYFWLFFQMLFTPEKILQTFGVGAEPHFIFLTRRISVLMLGFSVLVSLACNLRPSKARAVISTAVAVNMAGFACNSFWGMVFGMLTDPGIPFAGGTETVIAIFYAVFAVTDFRKSENASQLG